MFAPGFFAADYFAPGYWPEATSAVPGEVAANIFAGASVSATAELLNGAPVASFFAILPSGSGSRRRIPQRLPPQPVAIAATIAAAATLLAAPQPLARAAATLGGQAVLTATGETRKSFARADNDFWLIAA